MFRLLAAFILLAMAVPASLADERILSWHSEIVVEKGGDLVVTETIKVQAEGKEIKRGIFRDIPRLREGRKGKNPFEVLSVKRNGKKENYRTEDIGRGGIRIRIGRADVFLQPGPYTYEITYRTGRQLYFEEGRDALYYWNVNGTEWEFRADKVSATVVLPEGIKGTKVWGYTGKRGAKGEDYRGELTETGATIEATRPFRARENLTVVLEWPPALLDRRAYEEGGRDSPLGGEEAWRFTDLGNLPPWLGVLLFSGSLLYYLAVWVAMGRDPRKGTIIPLYGPPRGLSAAAVRYIHRMGYDGTCFSAGVIGLAAKGALSIRKEKIQGGNYILYAKEESQAPGHDGGVLAPDEARLQQKLLGGGPRLELVQTNHERIGGARDAHCKVLASQVNKVHFRLNLGWCFPGFILSLAGTVLFLFGIDFWTGLVVGLIGGMASLLAFGAGAGLQSFRLALITMVVLVVCVAVAQLSEGLRAAAGPLILCVIVYVLNLVFIYLIKAPTRLGRRVMDQIEGFRHYLSVAEEDRLNLENPPEKTPELFEQFLPYALALDCEQQWAWKFHGILQGAGTGDGYSPSFYSGSSGSLNGAMSDLGGSFTGSLSSSASAPSSGGGGGGGSGGGGGGGGGGGW